MNKKEIKSKLRDKLVDKKAIADLKADDENAFVGIYYKDLYDIIVKLFYEE